MSWPPTRMWTPAFCINLVCAIWFNSYLPPGSEICHSSLLPIHHPFSEKSVCPLGSLAITFETLEALPKCMLSYSLAVLSWYTRMRLGSFRKSGCPQNTYRLYKRKHPFRKTSLVYGDGGSSPQQIHWKSHNCHNEPQVFSQTNGDLNDTRAITSPGFSTQNMPPDFTTMFSVMFPISFLSIRVVNLKTTLGM